MIKKRIVFLRNISILLFVVFSFHMLSTLVVAEELEVIDTGVLGSVDNDSGENSGGGENKEGVSYILTGSTTMEVVLENDVNINVTDFSCGDCDTVASSSVATSSDDEILSASSSLRNISMENENLASTSNIVDSDAVTGDNLISSSGTEAFIITGDISLINIIVNFINNNFFGKGQQFFIDIFNTMIGSIDLSGFGDDFVQTENVCLVGNCDVTINNQNSAILDNSIVIEANTGNNLIVNSESGFIETGDIDIVNDIVNVANLNVTGEGWFFAVVNIFGALDGDVILPAYKEVLLEPGDEVVAIGDEVSTTSPEVSTEIYIANTNMAVTINEVLINANAGDNTASSSEGAQVLSGDIDLDINTFNFVNYNISGDYWKFAKINIFGNWRGFIEGLPEGFSYMEDDFGVTIYNDFLNNSVMSEVYVKQTVLNYNQATTTNSVVVKASTGENVALATADSYIHTGDINIRSSLMNFINTNFTGNNWEFSMINVFGEWKGNLAFGQGDLWITEAVSATEVFGGEYIIYTFLYGNKGDAEVTNVQVEDDFNEDLVDVQESSDGILSDGKITWLLGTISPNTQGSFSYVVKAKNTLATGVYKIYNQTRISGLENDRNYDNNLSYGTVELTVVDGAGSKNSTLIGGMVNNVFPSLKVTKTNNKNGIAYPGDFVDYEILIKNTGSANLEDVLVRDVMSVIGSGEITQQSMWDLGTLYVGEEVLIEYTVQIEEDAVLKMFINEVMTEGYDMYRGQYIYAIASSKLKIDEPIIFGSALSQGPDVGVAIRTDAKFYNPGDVAEIEIIVMNNGGERAVEIFLDSVLPDGLTFWEENGKVNNNWHFDWLNPGQMEVVKLKVLVMDSFVKDEYELVALVRGDNFKKFKETVKVGVRETDVLGVDFVVETREDKIKNDSDIEQGPKIIDNVVNIIEDGVKNEEEPFLAKLNNTKEKALTTQIEPEIREGLKVEMKGISYKIQFFIFFLIIAFLLYISIKVSDFYFSEKWVIENKKHGVEKK